MNAGKSYDDVDLGVHREFPWAVLIRRNVIDRNTCKVTPELVQPIEIRTLERVQYCGGLIMIIAINTVKVLERPT